MTWVGQRLGSPDIQTEGSVALQLWRRLSSKWTLKVLSLLALSGSFVCSKAGIEDWKIFMERDSPGAVHFHRVISWLSAEEACLALSGSFAVSMNTSVEEVLADSLYCSPKRGKTGVKLDYTGMMILLFFFAFDLDFLWVKMNLFIGLEKEWSVFLRVISDKITSREHSIPWSILGDVRLASTTRLTVSWCSFIR